MRPIPYLLDKYQLFYTDSTGNGEMCEIRVMQIDWRVKFQFCSDSKPSG